MTDEALRRLATAQMQRGRDLVGEGGGHALRRATVLFDRAIAIRRGLAASGTPRDRYDLAGAWLNKAEALLALEAASPSDRVLDAFDAAIEMLTAVAGRDRRSTTRLALALQNRALVKRRRPADAWQTASDLFRAIAVLSGEGEVQPDLWTLEATIWANVADAQLDEPEPAAWHRAIESAAVALERVRLVERDDEASCAAGLKARHVACRAHCRLLSRPTTPEPQDLVGRLTDIAEDGLRLARHWQDRGTVRFDGFAQDFFALGRRVYEQYQPHFVAEYDEEFVTLQPGG